jgi:hypothetical protein
MTPATCPRSFEAEAVRDGRLDGAERASFERHAKTCAACAYEVQALGALGQALGQRPFDSGDDLHVRRERTRLLAAFDRELVAPRRPAAAARWLLAAAAVFAIGAAGLGAWRIRDTRAIASRAEVDPEGTAAWSEHTEGDREVVVLERGALRIHVDHARPARHLVVLLPDGELEDTGTRFVVSAADGHTTGVTVQEGSVVLRVRGAAPVVLAAGERWAPAEPRAIEGLTPAIADAPAPPAPIALTGGARRFPPTASGAPERHVAGSASAGARDASVAFRAAMAALDRGDDRDAAAGFARFVAAHPGDTRAEDAAYLRVVALQRSGDDAEMKTAALDYLRRYPGGFRKAEVEALSR